jgi:hypothetical protein
VLSRPCAKQIAPAIVPGSNMGRLAGNTCQPVCINCGAHEI